MKFEKFISKRYLVSKHKVNFITIISLISIIGITIGVAALVVVISVFNGFGSLVTSFLVTFDPHVRVEFISDEGYRNEKQMLQTLHQINDIEEITPYISGKVVAQHKKEIQIIDLKGIDQESGDSVYQIKSNILFGHYDLSKKGAIPQVVLGLPLADKLQSIIGDTITVISPVGIEKAITQFGLPAMQKFLVSGVFSSNNNEYDNSYIFASLKYTQSLLGYKNRYQGYDIRLHNINEAFEVKEQLLKKLNQNDFSINTWYDFRKDLYSVMQVERWSAFILLSLIIAVATFNILGSLSMSVIEKRRDIGILRSMGTQEKSILKIFMFEGLLIGIIGTLAGLILGYGICFIHLKFNIYPLDPTQYKIDSLPLQLRITDLLYITGVSMLLSFLASLYPALKAARINVLEAIKWE